VAAEQVVQFRRFDDFLWRIRRKRNRNDQAVPTANEGDPLKKSPARNKIYDIIKASHHARGESR